MSTLKKAFAYSPRYSHLTPAGTFLRCLNPSWSLMWLRSQSNASFLDSCAECEQMIGVTDPIEGMKGMIALYFPALIFIPEYSPIFLIVNTFLFIFFCVHMDTG